jgi:hypothetical protein
MLLILFSCPARHEIARLGFWTFRGHAYLFEELYLHSKKTFIILFSWIKKRINNELLKRNNLRELFYYIENYMMIKIVVKMISQSFLSFLLDFQAIFPLYCLWYRKLPSCGLFCVGSTNRISAWWVRCTVWRVNWVCCRFRGCCLRGCLKGWWIRDRGGCGYLRFIGWSLRWFRGRWAILENGGCPRRLVCCGRGSGALAFEGVTCFRFWLWGCFRGLASWAVRVSRVLQL